MEKSKMKNIISSYNEMDPDRYDGSYELVREAVRAYEDCSSDALDHNDLNLVYLMSVGTWKHGYPQKEKTIQQSNLSLEQKTHLLSVLKSVKENAEKNLYEYAYRPGSVGMFGTGFYSFWNKTDKASIQRFIKLCLDILPLHDDDEIYAVAEEALSSKIKGMQAGAASMVLHCLKPFTFPVLNAIAGNNNAFSVLGVDLKKVGELTEYIPNCRKIKQFRDANFTVKNYRIFDLAAWSEPDSVTDKIKAVIQAYKADFETRDKEERYKWQAVGTYKKHWDIDTPDFLQMLESSFGDTYNLLRAGNYYPKRMLEVFAEEDPETVRSLFKMLYDEDLPFEERYAKFREGFDAHFKPQNLLHYQDLHAVSVYLSFEYPETYYIYKYSVVKNFIKQIGFNCKSVDAMTDAEKMDLTLDLFNTVLEVVLQDEELKQMSRDRLDGTCHTDDAYHMLTHDVIYFGSKQKDEYWPSPEEYDSHLTKEDWIQYILNVEKPNHPRPMQMLKALMELGGEATCKQLSEVYGGTVSGYVGCTVNLGKRAKKHFHLEPCMDGDKERFFPIPFWGRGVRNEQNEENYSYRIRPELFDALSEIDLSDISPYYDEKSDAVMNTNIEKNLILYGPPGTGKTYHSAIYAVAIIENRSLEEVAAEDYRKRYKQYKDEGRIEFTTFHQSYGYEEFIEGIKPIMSDDGEVSYDVVPGVFKAFCEKAASPIAKENYVFIIDEINRGNISKILGELITLIEADKRLGEEESLRVKLPYSQKEFGVPDNVYIIGTMNTADRSIAAIDTALRRRFAFKEMLPDTSIFSGIEVDGLSIGKLLDTMNRRIEALYDREHTIGHAYFMPLKNSRTLDTLGEIFKNKILPLLQEYFYEDYKKIRLVLGDNQKPKEAQFIQEDPVNEVDLFGEDTEYIEDAHQYIINEDAFTLKAAYEKLQ